MQETSPLLDPKGLDDLLLYRFSRVSATAGAMIVRWCEGRFGITWREWGVGSGEWRMAHGAWRMAIDD